jgi:hypothetical protein
MDCGEESPQSITATSKAESKSGEGSPHSK